MLIPMRLYIEADEKRTSKVTQILQYVGPQNHWPACHRMCQFKISFLKKKYGSKSLIHIGSGPQTNFLMEIFF